MLNGPAHSCVPAICNSLAQNFLFSNKFFDNSDFIDSRKNI